MAERDDLEFTIEIKNEFSKTIREFKDEVAEAGRQWKAFADSVSNNATALKKSVAQMNSAGKALADYRREINKSANAEQKIVTGQGNLGAQQKETNRLLRNLTSTVRRAVQPEGELGARIAKNITANEARLAVMRSLKKAYLDEIKELALVREGMDKLSRSTRQYNDRQRDRAVLENENAKTARKRRIAELRLAQGTKELAKSMGISEDQARTFQVKNLELSKSLGLLTAAEEANLEVLKKKQRFRIKNDAEDLLARERAPGGARINPRTGLTAEEGAQRRLRQEIQDYEELARLKVLRNTSKEFRRVKDAAEVTDRGVQKVLFTFRRLFGVLALFTIAREGLNAFVASIRETLRFAAELETAQLGIASLIAAAGQLTDAYGNILTPAQGLIAAQEIAKEQLAQLKRDSLATAATFQDLQNAFQSAIAPGLTAGLSVNEIRGLTLQISQAAAAIGLPQNQLAEEIRSLLAGTIQARTTRIATSLGITNEDINRAKELGILAEFLEDRFAAFSKAGGLAARTLGGLFTRAVDAFKQLGVAAFNSLGIIDELKGLLNDVINSIVVISDTDIKLNPGAQALIESFAGFLKTATEELRRFLNIVFNTGIFTEIATLVSGSLTAAIRFVSQVALQVSIAFALAAAHVNRIVKFLDIVRQTIVAIEIPVISWLFTTEAIYTALASIFLIVKVIATYMGAKLAGSAILWAARLSGVASILTNIKAITIAASRAMVAYSAAALRAIPGLKALVGAMIALTGPVTVIFVAFLAILGLIKEWVSSITGVELQLSDIFRLVRNEIRAIALYAVAYAQFALDESLRILTGGKTEKAGKTFAKKFLGALADGVGGTVGGIIRQFSGEVIDASTPLSRLRSQLNRIKSDADRKADSIIGGAKVREDAGETLGFFEELAAAVGRVIPEGIERRFNNLVELFGFGGTSAKDYASQLAGVVAVTNRTVESAEKAREAIKQLSLEYETARIEADAALRQQVGESQFAASLRALNTRDQIRELEQERELRKDLADAENRRSSQLREVYSLGTQLTRVAGSQVDLAGEALRATRGQLEAKKTLSSLETEIALQQEKLKKAKDEGNTSDEKSARNTLKLLKQQEQLQLDAIEALQNRVQGLYDQLERGSRDEILEISKQILEVEGQLQGTNLAISIIEDTRNKLARERLKILNEERRAILARAKEENKSLFLNIADRDKEVAAAGLSAKASSEPNRFLADLYREQAAALELQLKRRRELREIDTQLLAAQANFDQAKQNKDLEAAAIFEGRLGLLNIQRVQSNKQLTAEIEAQKQKLREAEERVSSPITSSFKETIDTQLRSLTDQFTTVAAGINSIFSQLGQGIQNAISQALFPAEGESASKAWARVAKGIITTMVSTFAQLAATLLVFTLIPGFATTAAASDNQAISSLAKTAQRLRAGVGSIFGYAEGGLIPDASGFASPAHRRARGYAGGGQMRPSGLDPRDTVPIWAQPGEFMLRKSAVDKYGAGVIAAINKGLVDPMSLSALAPLGGVSSSAKIKPGFASGGKIPVTAAPGTGGGATGAMPALVVSSEQHLDRLLSGGKRAMMNFFEENRTSLRTILG